LSSVGRLINVSDYVKNKLAFLKADNKLKAEVDGGGAINISTIDELIDASKKLKECVLKKRG